MKKTIKKPRDLPYLAPLRKAGAKEIAFQKIFKNI
jgi:hypothetical protein